MRAARCNVGAVLTISQNTFNYGADTMFFTLEG